MSVEVVERGGAVGTSTALEYGTKHTYGIHKAKDTNAWAVGIEARVPKLGRIDASKEIATTIRSKAVTYARSKGIPLNGAMIGIAYECLRLTSLGGKYIADAIIAKAPADWQPFLREVAYDKNLQDLYLKLREIGV